MNKIVQALIVPDMYTHRPLIGMDIGPENMFKARTCYVSPEV